MSRWKAIGPVLAVALLIIGLIADVVTIRQFGFHLWEPITNSGDKDGRGASPVQLPSPRPTLIVTATPTPIPPLDKQLEEALSVATTSVRNKALLLVAQNAVLLGDYLTAIKAASATPSSSAQATNLAFVVRCAIEDGLYDFAAEAADKVKVTSARDSLKVEVIEARGRTPLDKGQPTDGTGSHADRESMACFGSPAE